MKIPTIYELLLESAMYNINLDYTDEQIADKLFDKINDLYLDRYICEDVYNQLNYKQIERIIINARIKLDKLGINT